MPREWSANEEDAFLVEVAQAVRAVILPSARRSEFGLVLRMGADGTPTKLVDDLAEREILRLLEARDAPFNLLSEEAGFVDRGHASTLVADPIDGTTNAYRGIPLYCVSLAIGTQSLCDVRAGIVLNVPTGEAHVARRGRGAFLGGERLRGRSPDPKDLMISVTAGKGSKLAALEHAYPRLNVRSLGSAALEMCFVAQGALDAFLFPVPAIRIIDIAASTLILREAGGLVLDRDLADLDMPLSLQPRASLVAVASKETLGFVEGLF